MNVLIRCKLLRSAFHPPEHGKSRGLRFANRTLRLLFIRSKAFVGCAPRTRKYKRLNALTHLKDILVF